MEEYKTGLNDPSYNYVFNIKTKKFIRLTQPNFQVVKVVGDHIVTTNALYFYADKKYRKNCNFLMMFATPFLTKTLKNAHWKSCIATATNFTILRMDSLFLLAIGLLGLRTAALGCPMVRFFR